MLNKKNPLDFDHLILQEEEKANISIQRSEALLLHSIILVCQPRVILEFGFHLGASAKNFLYAALPNAILHSFDTQDLQNTAKELSESDCRFKFHQKSQVDFHPNDINNEVIDFIFFDASHDLILNQETWKKVLPCFSEKTIVAVHDTGTWNRDLLNEIHKTYISTYGKDNFWVNEKEFAHQPDERLFVNWIKDEYGFSAVHFHSLNVARHGLTILQNIQKLP